MKIKLLLALLIMQFGYAQHRTCGVKEQMQLIMNNPAAKKEYLQIQDKFRLELNKLAISELNKTANTTLNTNELIRIPVAVHFPSVIAANTTISISLRACLVQLAQSQINILNADYNGTNADISNWSTASSFFPGTNIGSLNVSFELATVNHPAGTGLGFPANGSPAVTFGTDFLNNADTDTTWAGYCNLVVRNIAGGILGYSPLGGSPSQGMTVVIDNNAFGTTLTTSPTSCTGYVPGAPYNLGRTLTHELGHFFNLEHTFNGCETDCSYYGPPFYLGDGCCDTPSTNDEYYNCVAPGSVATTCGGLPQLTMNYMDYVEDSCMYMFTANQATRMQAWYNTILPEIKANVLGNTDFITSNISIAPNPNNGTFTIQFKDLSTGYSVEVYDVSGRVLYQNNFNYSSDLLQTVKLEDSAKGVYFVNLKSNGTILTKKIIIE